MLTPLNEADPQHFLGQGPHRAGDSLGNSQVHVPLNFFSEDGEVAPVDLQDKYLTARVMLESGPSGGGPRPVKVSSSNDLTERGWRSGLGQHSLIKQSSVLQDYLYSRLDLLCRPN